MAREWTDTDIAEVKKLIASGVQSVTFQNRGVTYHGLVELQQLLSQMLRERDEEAGTPRFKRLNTTKGF